MTRFQRAGVVFGLITLCIPGLDSQARGQAIAFEPIVAPAFSGSTMTVTPVVSPDRRYVRLSVDAYFNAINGFSSFTTPLGAVSGGGGGGNFNAGMNGVIGQSGFDGGSGTGQAGFVGQVGEMRAGPLPIGGGFGGDNSLLLADGLHTSGAVGWDDWREGDFAGAESWPLANVSPAQTRPGRSVRATPKTNTSQRRAARNASHRQNSTATRRRGH
jgi:hypothetical protein